MIFFAFLFLMGFSLKIFLHLKQEIAQRDSLVKTLTVRGKELLDENKLLKEKVNNYYKYNQTLIKASKEKSTL